MIIWDPLTNQFVTNSPRQGIATHIARRTTTALHGYSGLTLLDVIGATERGRIHANDVIGAHLVPHSGIETMVCEWMNNPITGLPKFLMIVGGLVTPPMSYCTSVPLLLLMGSDVLGSVANGFATLTTRILTNQNTAAIWASGLAQYLSNTHVNLRLGDRTTNSSIGALVDARISRNRGLDPMAWMESLYQYSMGDPRPRVSAESIYAASFLRLQLDPSAHQEAYMSWDWPGNNNNLRSSVDGTAIIRATGGGNNVTGFLATPIGGEGVFQNPLRRVAHIPYTRLPLCVSWYGLFGLLSLVFILFQFNLLMPLNRIYRPM
jgi:hypothetical protein